MTNEIKIRDRILTEAHGHFLRFGFAKTTMSGIAADLGMSKRTVYSLYTSKEELLREVVNRLNRETAEKVDALVDRNGIGFPEKLKLLLELGLVLFARLPHRFLADIQKNAPGVWKECDCFRREHMRSKVMTIVRQGVDAGCFRRDVDVQVLVLLYSAALQSLITAEVLSQLPLSTQEVFEAIMRILFEGILTEETRKTLITHDPQEGTSYAL